MRQLFKTYIRRKGQFSCIDNVVNHLFSKDLMKASHLTSESD